MKMLTLIIGLSMIMWYVIDRFKPLWSELSYGKYITIGLSAVFGFGLAFGFGLDLVNAIGLYGAATPIGTALTGFLLMSGSSAVSEIIGKIKG
jgi:hypothetical protein